MNTEGVEEKACEIPWTSIKLCTAKEALRHEARNIVVPENVDLTLSPSHPELLNYFVRVPLKTYEDLQLLGFVPRKLSEEKVRQAIAADDEEAYKLSGTLSPQAPSDCECKNTLPRASSYSQNLRSIYNGIRKTHNPSLARLLSDHFSTHITWDDPVAGITRKWALYLDSRLSKVLLVAILMDITINRGASLAVDANVKSFLAHNIQIHRTGRLIQQGSYMKIWANSMTTFLDFTDVLTQVPKVAPPWLIGLATE
jgi:hypothetical protein